MLASAKLKTVKFPMTIITVAILLFGFLCSGMFHKMSMALAAMDSAAMSTTQDQPCCAKSISNQFGVWKDVILVAPDRTRGTLVLLALSLALIFGYSLFSPWNRKPQFEPDIGRLYFRENPDLILFNHLKLAFAKGILNPKIY